MYTKIEFASVDEAQSFVNQKSQELEVTMKCKVYPILLVESEDPLDLVIGFLKAPSRDIKVRAIDMIRNEGPMQGGSLLLNACLIKAESDPRLGDPSSAYDELNIGAMGAATKVVEFRVDISKKK